MNPVDCLLRLLEAVSEDKDAYHQARSDRDPGQQPPDLKGSDPYGRPFRRANDRDEVDQLKAEVHCATVLERLPPPWRLDRRESTRRALKYRRGRARSSSSTMMAGAGGIPATPKPKATCSAWSSSSTRA